MQDAKNMRILRTHNQVGNTDMLAGSYRVVKIHRKMKHQTLPGKGVIQEIESEGFGAANSTGGDFAPWWTDLCNEEWSGSKMLRLKSLEWEKY